MTKPDGWGMAHSLRELIHVLTTILVEPGLVWQRLLAHDLTLQKWLVGLGMLLKSLLLATSCSRCSKQWRYQTSRTHLVQGACTAARVARATGKRLVIATLREVWNLLFGLLSLLVLIYVLHLHHLHHLPNELLVLLILLLKLKLVLGIMGLKLRDLETWTKIGLGSELELL